MYNARTLASPGSRNVGYGARVPQRSASCTGTGKRQLREVQSRLNLSCHRSRYSTTATRAVTIGAVVTRQRRIQQQSRNGELGEYQNSVDGMK